MNWKKTAVAAAMALGVVGAVSLAQPFVQSAQAHQGMMGGYGNGPAAGSGYGGYHMGPGMMGGYGGYGMGPGMMGGYGGYGMGPGMMGGYGGNHMGGFGLGPLYRLNLTDEQHKQIDGIEDGLRKKNWGLMGKMQDEMSKLNGLGTEKQDRSAILAANKRMFELRQQMLENGLDAQDKVESLLTPQQKGQYKKLSQSRFDNDD